LEINAIEK
jgi:hypothetical protein